MDQEEIEKQLGAFFANNKVRVVAENPQDKFSSVWIFWAYKNDFYFGASSAANALKVSLHENGRGYLAYNKPYLLSKKAEGFDIGDKTKHEWALPIPGPVGATHAATLMLPADFCNSDAHHANAKRKIVVYSIEKGCAAEIGLFLSYEGKETLEPKLVKIGQPLGMFTLDNKLNVSIVARSRTFDPSVLRTGADFEKAKRTQLMKTEDLPFDQSLNAMFWNAPKDGEAIQVVDIGGVRIQRKDA